MKLKQYLTEVNLVKNIVNILLKAAVDKRLDDTDFRALALKHLRRII